MKPEALIFDVDDTLADVTNSYRMATVATAAHFGVTITFEDITEAKAAGNANNDGVLTRAMIARRGVDVDLDSVTRKFEEFYQGTSEARGMRHSETLMIDKAELEALSREYQFAIVTGRPRRDAENFVTENGLSDLFKVVVTMDDGPLKPSPAPIRLALQKLGVSTAIMFGDTPDDMRAAVAAGIVGIGVVAPSDDPEVATPALITAGATRVIRRISELREVLS